MKVKDIMNKPAVTVGPKDDVRSAAALMNQYDIGAVAVTDEHGGVAGIITDRDIAIRCAVSATAPADTYAEKIMSKGIISVVRKTLSRKHPGLWQNIRSADFRYATTEDWWE